VTVKSVLFVNVEVEAFVVEPEAMSMRSIELAGNVPIAWPFTFVPVKPTVPKFVSGSTPLRLDGASAIASAENSDPRPFCVVEKVPLRLSVIEIEKRLLPA